LYLVDQRADLLGGVLGLLGELSDLFGDDREPAALLARPGGLDRRVQSEQVGLLGVVTSGPARTAPRSSRRSESPLSSPAVEEILGQVTEGMRRPVLV
jgi:hypothetical protein